MKKPVDVLVVGAGPIGVCCAYWLAQCGASVTLIEREESVCPPRSAAHGNCGLVTPSEVVPLAAPGVLRRGVRWMLRSTSPFHITPRPSPSLARWLWLFRAACKRDACGSRIPSLARLHEISARLHGDLARAHGDLWRYRRNGLVEVCETTAGLEELTGEVREMRGQGVVAEELTASRLRERCPGLLCGTAGGFFFPADAHVDPLRFTRSMARLAAAEGAQVLTGVEALALRADAGAPARLLTTRGELRAWQVVVAAGVLKPAATRDRGRRFPIEAAKGLSSDVTTAGEFGEAPVLLLEEGTVLTPLGGVLRIGSTLEISGEDTTVPPRRVAHLRRVAARAAGSPADGDVLQVWRGLRPLSPDGLPFVGRCPGHDRVIVATGHCMLGLSLGPATGLLVAELAGGQSLSLDLRPFSPARFS